MRKLIAVLTLLRRGQEVTDPATWKNRAIAVSAVAALLAALLACARAWGYDIPLTEAELVDLATGLVALVGAGNVILHVVTSRKVGLLPPVDSGDGSSAGDATPRPDPDDVSWRA